MSVLNLHMHFKSLQKHESDISIPNVAAGSIVSDPEEAGAASRDGFADDDTVRQSSTLVCARKTQVQVLLWESFFV